jgi:hypothetical protein
MMKSKIFTLDSRDLINGLIVAFLTVLLSGLIEILGNGTDLNLHTLKPVIIAGISAALSYLLKNLVTNSRNQLFTREPVKI